MTINYVSQSINTVTDGSSNTTITGTLPAGGADGNLLVALIASGDSENPSSLTAPTGWTMVDHNFDDSFGHYSNGNFTVHTGIAWAIRDPSLSLEFGTTASITDDFIAILEFSGDFDGTTPVQGVDRNFTGSGTDLTTPSITTPTDNSLLMSVAAHDPGDPNVTDDTGEPTGMTMLFNRRSSSNSNSVRLGAAYEVIATAGATGTRTWTAFGDDTYRHGFAFAVAHTDGPTVDADASTFPGDTINHTVSGFDSAINSTTLDDGTSTLTLTSPGDTSAVVPALGNDIQYTTFGADRTYTVGDGAETATDTVDLDPPTGYTLVTLSASPDTSATSWLYNYGTAPAAGDQGVYDPVAGDTGATLTLNDDGTWSSDGSGTWDDIYVIDASDGMMEQITFTAVGITDSPTEVAPAASYSITLDLEVTVSSVTLGGETQTIDSQSSSGGETTVNLTAVQGDVKFANTLSLVANIDGGGLADADINLVPITDNAFVNVSSPSTAEDSVFRTGALEGGTTGDQVEWDDASNTTVAADGTITQSTKRDFNARLWDATTSTWGAWTVIADLDPRILSVAPTTLVANNTFQVELNAINPNDVRSVSLSDGTTDWKLPVDTVDDATHFTSTAPSDLPSGANLTFSINESKDARQLRAVADDKAPMQIPTYTVAGVPSAASNARQLIHVSDDVGGETIAFSDGTNWRRVQDLAIISTT